MRYPCLTGQKMPSSISREKKAAMSSLSLRQPYAETMWVYVEPPYRNRGLSRMLCKALEDWAADLGCIEFASDVLLQNALGQRVHEALGFEETERVVFYTKRLA